MNITNKNMNSEEQLKKLEQSLGMLAPKGTWFCEVLENIWHAKTSIEANGIAEYARNTFDKIGICECLWIGDREEKRPDKNGDKNIGVLIYKDSYYNFGMFQFYWGGDDWTDPKILDLYYDREIIIEEFFENNEENFEKFWDDMYISGMREYMENTYSFETSLEETEKYFKQNENEWRWIDVVPDAYND